MTRRMNNKYTTLLILLLTFICTLQIFFKTQITITRKGNSTALTETKTGDRYVCYYSSLWCGCYSQTYGCHTACAPMHVLTISNVTECAHREAYFLSGFTKI